MPELPSALELESLSDSELADRIDAALIVIKDSKTLHGDDSDQQQLYRALITDQSRRKAAVTNEAKSDGA